MKDTVSYAGLVNAYITNKEYQKRYDLIFRKKKKKVIRKKKRNG